jgi:protoheme IX farnesyltransferase
MAEPTMCDRLSDDERTGVRLSSPVAPAASAASRAVVPVQAPPAAARPRGWRATVGAYVALTKPRIIELLLVTTVPTMVLAARGLPSLSLVAVTLVGGALAAGSANVLNCYLDRDIDAVMHRTRRRPTVTGAVSPTATLVFGIVLGVVALAMLWFAVNPISALFAAGAIAIYVVGYTMLLKRRTSQNIVWGGAAGCMPVLIGWSAVTGGVSWSALLLFGVVFFWTPPHYWPLSMKFRADYQAAGVPMLPVVRRDAQVAAQMVGYTLAMVACSLLLVPVAGMTWVYAAAAAVLGVWFLGSCLSLLRQARDPEHHKVRAMRVFHHSITYLTLLSVAVVVDVFLPL